MTKQEKLDIIDKAIARLRAGWCQWHFFDLQAGECCMVGAVRCQDVDLNLVFLDWDALAGWNDAPGRTQAQVIRYYEIRRYEVENDLEPRPVSWVCERAEFEDAAVQDAMQLGLVVTATLLSDCR